MKLFLHLAAFTSVVWAAILAVLTIEQYIPNSGWLAVGLCLFAMYSSVNCLKEFYDEN